MEESRPLGPGDDMSDKDEARGRCGGDWALEDQRRWTGRQERGARRALSESPCVVLGGGRLLAVPLGLCHGLWKRAPDDFCLRASGCRVIVEVLQESLGGLGEPRPSGSATVEVEDLLEGVLDTLRYWAQGPEIALELRCGEERCGTVTVRASLRRSDAAEPRACAPRGWPPPRPPPRSPPPPPLRRARRRGVVRLLHVPRRRPQGEQRRLVRRLVQLGFRP
ncbi:unnamed protein product, partial [Prorocentrum cordatum]